MTKCKNNTITAFVAAQRRSLIHSVKAGLALVLVSLVYMLDPMFDQVGENAMWTIMTVVVTFEFYAGATLGKGINRGIGTLVGGGLGCLPSILGHHIGGLAKPIIIAISLFLFGCAATYCRLVPTLKKRYDYGFMIAILTFNLVAIVGVRTDKIIEVACSRLATIAMGFGVCLFVNLLIFPFWASDELHYLAASNFHKLAICLQGCLDEYFTVGNEKENQGGYDQGCKSILNSKSSDESLANFAKWEPWHGKFGLYYPWKNYLEIGEHLRELAVTILSLKACLQSSKQADVPERQAMREPCESFATSIGWALKEMGVGVKDMEMRRAKVLMTTKLRSIKHQPAPDAFSLSCGGKKINDGDERVAVGSLNFLVAEIVERVEKLAEKVEELGEVARFKATKVDV